MLPGCSVNESIPHRSCHQQPWRPARLIFNKTSRDMNISRSKKCGQFLKTVDTNVPADKCPAPCYRFYGFLTTRKSKDSSDPSGLPSLFPLQNKSFSVEYLIFLTFEGWTPKIIARKFTFFEPWLFIQPSNTTFKKKKLKINLHGWVLIGICYSRDFCEIHWLICFYKNS